VQLHEKFAVENRARIPVHRAAVHAGHYSVRFPLFPACPPA
jgi:hypothetical protein